MDDSSDDSTPPSSPPIAQKSKALEDILLKLGPLTSVLYEPFKYEPQQTVRALLPASLPPQLHPFDYFSLFFTRELFQTITTNTNRYASIQRLYILEEQGREWTDLLIEELYVFPGVIIYIRVYYEPRVEMS
jgi:hypothetical protein